MSTSKARRARREWMHEERERAKSAAAEAARTAQKSTNDDWRRRLSRIVPPSEANDVIYPQGRLEQPYIQVCAPDRVPEALFDDYSLRRAMMFDSRIEIIGLRARQMALRLPHGANVVWWTWEIGS